MNGNGNIEKIPPKRKRPLQQDGEIKNGKNSKKERIRKNRRRKEVIKSNAN